MPRESIMMVVSSYHGTGGHDVVINNLSNVLEKMGYNIKVGAFSFHQSPPDHIEKVVLKKFRSLTRNLDGSIIDIVHSHQPRMNYYSLVTSAPFVFHYHGTSSKLQDINLKLSTMLCRNRISETISVSHSALNHLRHVVGEVSAEVIPNGVDSQYYHTNLPKPYTKGDPQLLFVGTLYPYKNVKKLVEEIPRILLLYPKVHFQIVGYGDDYPRLQFEIKKRRLENVVELVGPAYGEELRLRYSSCDIYVSASKMESFDIPALEAMACGKPVVLSDIPSHKEILESSKAGLLFSLYDNMPISYQIKKVYDNRGSYSSAARKFAKENDWSVICHNIARIYDKIISQK